MPPSLLPIEQAMPDPDVDDPQLLAGVTVPLAAAHGEGPQPHLRMLVASMAENHIPEHDGIAVRFVVRGEYERKRSFARQRA